MRKYPALTTEQTFLLEPSSALTTFKPKETVPSHHLKVIARLFLYTNRAFSEPSDDSPLRNLTLFRAELLSGFLVQLARLFQANSLGLKVLHLSILKNPAHPSTFGLTSPARRAKRGDTLSTLEDKSGCSKMLPPGIRAGKTATSSSRGKSVRYWPALEGATSEQSCEEEGPSTQQSEQIPKGIPIPILKVPYLHILKGCIRLLYGVPTNPLSASYPAADIGKLKMKISQAELEATKKKKKDKQAASKDGASS
ncbi:hypothetical protein FNV43_RR11683 [Rhamnella rubrinervis]|uniref:Uncharacterized protein n=1 Tax=Rhamnella rubrinervis TaxID=2594499 RepID=A0A8K0H6M4_9ROSA|nr:hypothetical protein FNV43_RR11683 [Rhamnella rubrinervis]